MQKIKRDNMIDVAKFIGIFLVVFGHVTKNNTLLYTFHMPLFFILAGYTFVYTEKNKYTLKQFFLKKIKSIIIPYFVFLLISFVYWILVERLFRTSDNIDIIGNIINIPMGLTKSDWYASNIVMWFLPCLFIADFLFYIIRRFVSKEWIICLIIFICGVLGFVLCYFKILLLFGLETALIALIFLEIGYIMNKYCFFEKMNGYVSIIVIILCLFSLYGTVKINGSVNMLEHEYKNQIIFLIGAILGSYSVLCISNMIKKNINIINKVLIFIGKNSIGIMVIHEPIKRLIIKIISIIFNIDVELLRTIWWISLIITIIIIAVIIPIIQIITRICPQILGKKKKEC